MSSRHRVKTIVRVTHVYQDDETGCVHHRDCTKVIHEIDRVCRRVPLVGRAADDADALLQVQAEEEEWGR